MFLFIHPKSRDKNYVVTGCGTDTKIFENECRTMFVEDVIRTCLFTIFVIPAPGVDPTTAKHLRQAKILPWTKGNLYDQPDAT